MCLAYRIDTDTSLVIMTWSNTWNHVLKDQLFLFLEHTPKIFLGRSQLRN